MRVCVTANSKEPHEAHSREQTNKAAYDRVVRGKALEDEELALSRRVRPAAAGRAGARVPRAEGTVPAAGEGWWRGPRGREPSLPTPDSRHALALHVREPPDMDPPAPVQPSDDCDPTNILTPAPREP